MINTPATQTSGTSGNMHNLNQYESLSKLHSIIVRMKRLINCMKVYDDVKNEHGRKRVQTLDFLVQTRWNFAHGETMCVTSNQYGLDVVIRKIAF